MAQHWPDVMLLDLSMPVMAGWTLDRAARHAATDPPIFDVQYVTSPEVGFPLVAVDDLPPEISDIGRIIHTERNWRVYSGWHNLGPDLAFEISVVRPISTRFALRFSNELLGSAMSRIHRAGGFTFSCVAPNSCVKQIITFVIDPNQLIDTLAELRPTLTRRGTALARPDHPTHDGPPTCVGRLCCVDLGHL